MSRPAGFFNQAISVHAEACFVILVTFVALIVTGLATNYLRIRPILEISTSGVAAFS